MFFKSKWIIIIKCIIVNLFVPYLHNSNIFGTNNHCISTLFNISTQQPFYFLAIIGNNSIYKEQKNISSEVIIYGLNNYLLKNKMKGFFANIIKNTNNVDKSQIQNWINKMKLSGFFKYVNCKLYYLDNHQIIIIDIIPNSILSKIYILNYQDKLIPYPYVLFLFRSQLGYPKSFAQINYAIIQMTRWYHLRGYKWAQIHLQHINFKSHCIVLKIYEGKINTIEIIGSLVNIKKLNDQNVQIVNLIIDLLQIKPNQILNVKSLEKGIINLKLQQIILQCNYEISINYIESSSLNIKLVVEILDDMLTYFFVKNILIPFNLSESLELLVEYSINYLLFNNIQAQMLLNNTIGRLINQNYITTIYDQNQLLYINISYYDSLVYKLLNSSARHYLEKISEWYISPLILIMGNNVGLRYGLRNINDSNKNCIIDMYFMQKYFQFNLNYEDPWFSSSINNKTSIYCAMFQNIYIYDFNIIPLISAQFNNQYVSPQNSIVGQQGLQIEFKHNLDSFFYLGEKISLKKLRKQYILLHNYVTWPSLISKINLYQKNFLSQFKPIFLDNSQKFLSLLFNFTYNNFKRINDFLDDNKFTVESICFLPETVIVPKNYLNLILNYSYNLKFIFLQNYLIQLLPFNFQNECLRFNIEFFTSLNSGYYFPFGEIFCLLGQERLIRNNGNLFLLHNLKLTSINIEYHFICQHTHSLYMFIDYIDNIYSIKKNKATIQLYNSSICDRLSTNVEYGIGIRIQIPIRQIPSIRLQYFINTNNDKCFHLKINR